MIRFEIYLDSARLYRWRLVAANNEIVAVGESYTVKSNAIAAVNWVKNVAFSAAVRDLT